MYTETHGHTHVVRVDLPHTHFLGSCVHPTHLCDTFFPVFVFASHLRLLIIYIDTRTHTWTHAHTWVGIPAMYRVVFPPGAPSLISGKC